MIRSGGSALTEKMAVVVARAVSWRILYICTADTCTRSSGVQRHCKRTLPIRADGGGLQPAAVNPAQWDLVPPPRTSKASHSTPRLQRLRRCAALEILHQVVVNGHGFSIILEGQSWPETPAPELQRETQRLVRRGLCGRLGPIAVQGQCAREGGLTGCQSRSWVSPRRLEARDVDLHPAGAGPSAAQI